MWNRCLKKCLSRRPFPAREYSHQVRIDVKSCIVCENPFEGESDACRMCSRKMQDVITNYELVILDSSEGSSECVICLEEMSPDSKLLRLSCGHTFHEHCFRKWMLKSDCCPMCACSSLR